MRAPKVSFEFFPPSDPENEARLRATVERLAPLGPQFVSVTYGADGSTRDRTHRIVEELHDTGVLTVAPHLTCIDASREEVLAVARRYVELGIRHIVALRGDPPAGKVVSVRADGFAHAVDLVHALARTGNFHISVAAYPETHPQAPSAQFDLVNLKRKVDAGASRAVTQFFFETAVYLRFRDRCAGAGIDVPIVPGILPITQFPQILKFAARCGASVPRWLVRRFEGLEQDAETRRLISAAVAIEQVQKLQEEGVEEFHFYTLNRAELSYAICHALGARSPSRPAADHASATA